MKAVGWVRVGVDCVLLGAATAIAVSPLATVYDGSAWVRAAALGLLAAIGVTLVARAVRVGALLTTLLLVVAYLVVAPAAAAPDRAVGGVLPGADSLQTVLKGLVQSWRTVVTQPVPLGSTHGELVVPFVIALAGPFLATTLLWRSRWSGLAAVPVAAMFAAAAAFGTRVTETPMLRGLLLVVLLTAWLRLRNAHGASSFWLRRIGMSAALLAVAGAIGWGAAAAVRQGGREVLRDHVDPPLAELDFKSPLSRYRDFYKSHGDEVLFTFRDLPEDTRLIRLATMDSFDGYVWNVSTTELLSGSSAFRTAPPTSGARTTHVTVGDYSGPWIPTVGRATAATLTHDGADGAERELLLNTATGTVAQFGDGRSKDEYDIAWEPTNEGDEVEASAVDRSYPLSEMNVPTIEKLDTLARGWISTTDADTDYERARALVKGFRDNGYFNDGLDEKEFGVSASGHGLKRLADMVSDERRIVGNDEQYASAMAYVAQRMGMPARVVIGFDQMEDGSVTGNDIAAWVEIPFKGEGWVAFDPTPEERKTPPPLKNSPDPAPQPFVVQPPLLPEVPADTQGVPPDGSGRELTNQVWATFLLILGVVWLFVRILLVLSPLWLILVAKWWRRRRRQRAPEPLERISGAWREFSERARDLGARVPAGYTRHETSSALATRFPETDSLPLADTADRHVFGPGSPTEDEVAAYWADVDSAVTRMRQEVPWWRRAVAHVSPVSLPWGAIRDRLPGRRS